jgi:hypothetical protein
MLKNNQRGAVGGLDVLLTLLMIALLLGISLPIAFKAL